MNKKEKDKIMNLLKQYKHIVSDERLNGRYEFISGDLDKTYKEINIAIKIVEQLEVNDD